MAILHEQARAKVNLSLDVIGRRADGYHLLDSLVMFADVGDALSFAPSNEPYSLDIEGPFAGVLSDQSDNLIIAAARRLRSLSAEIPQGRFTLTKNLPVASGIGGGSADAAAALRLLMKAADGAVFDATAIDRLCLSLGADVPICYRSEAGFMTGIGEGFHDAGVTRSLPAVLVNPGVAVSTAEIFKALNVAEGGFEKSSPAGFSNEGEFLSFVRGAKNDLQDPAINLCSAIGDVLAALRSSESCLTARMSGSGATCFGLFESEDEAEDVARSLGTAHRDWWVQATVLR